MHVWTKRCRDENLDAWRDVILELPGVNPTCVVATWKPGKVWHTIEVFGESAAELADISRLLGGSVRAIADETWSAGLKRKRGAIHIRNRFSVVESASENPARPEIVIPAGMAFGTGDHPTTATCLRLLVDVAERLTAKGKWSLLDVGTGSGVLAIAARMLGADVVEAFDFDPNAVRTAQENAQLNHITGVKWSVADVLKFEAVRDFHLVAANIYSELFREAWPRLQKAVKSDGWFLLSGILRAQADECEAVLRGSGFVVFRKVVRGKWVTMIAERENGERMGA
ncbi:MAG TPA: 50S ribosomal protein L11 methyltransferase [Chthoniobacterales bacterium]